MENTRLCSFFYLPSFLYYHCRSSGPGGLDHEPEPQFLRDQSQHGGGGGKSLRQDTLREHGPAAAGAAPAQQQAAGEAEPEGGRPAVRVGGRAAPTGSPAVLPQHAQRERADQHAGCVAESVIRGAVHRADSEQFGPVREFIPRSIRAQR
jgi:hypothetical protein